MKDSTNHCRWDNFSSTGTTKLIMWYLITLPWQFDDLTLRTTTAALIFLWILFVRKPVEVRCLNNFKPWSPIPQKQEHKCLCNENETNKWPPDKSDNGKCWSTKPDNCHGIETDFKPHPLKPCTWSSVLLYRLARVIPLKLSIGIEIFQKFFLCDPTIMTPTSKAFGSWRILGRWISTDVEMDLSREVASDEFSFVLRKSGRVSDCHIVNCNFVPNCKTDYRKLYCINVVRSDDF